MNIESLKKSWNRIKFMTIKEFQNVWTDKRIRGMILTSPIMQLLIFAYTANLEVRDVSMIIYDKDNTQYSRELTSKFQNNKKLVKKIYYIDSRGEMIDLIDKQKALFALIIPEGFQKNIITKEGTEVQFIMDGRKANSSQIFMGYANTITQTYAAELSGGGGKINVVTRNWFNPNLNYNWYMVITLTAILSMTTALIITALSLAQEKEFGTFDQTIVSPLQPFEILVGKTIPAIVFSIFDVVQMLFLSIWLFKIPLESPLWVLCAVTFVFLLSISGIGLFISAMCKSQQQAILGVFAFMVPALLISGFVTEVENMPPIMHGIGLINPVTYYLLIIKGLYLKTMPAYLIIQYTIPLIIISIFTLAFAGWFFKRKLD